MFESVRESIYEAISSIRLVDPHTHINPHNPGSQTLADILGYHYYTELIHSSGMPKSEIESDDLSPKELVSRLVRGLPNIENTANYQWLINICQIFFDFQDDRITESNWEHLYDHAESKMSSAEWPQMVLDQSNVEAVFLTNDFDDDLEGFDTNTYIPCLRTDDLVFHLTKRETRDRLAACTGTELDGSLESLRASLRQRFEHFVPRGARACAISIPPSFQPTRVGDGRAQTALDAVLTQGIEADESHQAALSRRVFWTLAELCDEFGLPFDLMIGVNRRVYPDGVYQGQDLYDSRVSLIQYKELFNAFTDVKFPISVLASVTNQELVSYSWIFPNVLTNGHWWYSNTPSFIQRDAAARLEAVPRNKQIGYYSDAYKLEFVWPKFDMYRRILAGVLAENFVGGCGWSEERAIELAQQILRGNVDEIFPNPNTVDEVAVVEEVGEGTHVLTQEFSALAATVDEVAELDEVDIEEEEPESDDQTLGIQTALTGAGAALAAGAIGLVEVAEGEESAEVAEHEELEDELDEVEVEEEVDEIVAVDEEEFLIDPTQHVVEHVDPEIEDEEPLVEADEPVGMGQMETVEFSDINQTVVEEQAYEEHAYVEGAEEMEVDTYDLSETAPVEFEQSPIAGVQQEFSEIQHMVEQESLEAEGSEQYVDVDDEEEGEAVEEEPAAYENAELDLDPLPSHDEIQAVDVEDVELRDVATEIANEVESIESQLDPEPLDVGDLISNDLDEIAQEADAGSTEIRMLRGETGFVPDEESLQLDKDPSTGELRFEAPDEFGAGLEVPDGVGAVSDDADSVTEDPINELETMIQDTISDLDDDASDDDEQ